MTVDDILLYIRSLDLRERLMAKLAIIAGMRPGELFALRWGRIGEAVAHVKEAVYEGVLDTPKSDRGRREAALANGLLSDMLEWKSMSNCEPDSFVFPSEVGTPLSSHNVWQRNSNRSWKPLASAGARFR